MRNQRDLAEVAGNYVRDDDHIGLATITPTHRNQGSTEPLPTEKTV